MNCDPTDQKCKYTPRQAGQACSATVAGRTCAAGLVCHPKFADCVETSSHGDFCYAGMACDPGLSCQPGIQQCFSVPRAWGEPCNAANPCMAGLECDPAYPYCH